MRETTSEIKKVFDKHQYSIDSIVFDVMQTFKLRSILRLTQFEKQEGYAVTEVLALLIMFPLMMLSSVNSFFHSEFQAITTMKNDTIYCLKNNGGPVARGLSTDTACPLSPCTAAELAGENGVPVSLEQKWQ